VAAKRGPSPARFTAVRINEHQPRSRGDSPLNEYRHELAVDQVGEREQPLRAVRVGSAQVGSGAYWLLDR
jgi:hypothetical protein